jgi:hypothetical protein
LRRRFPALHLILHASKPLRLPLLYMSPPHRNYEVIQPTYGVEGGRQTALRLFGVMKIRRLRRHLLPILFML